MSECDSNDDDNSKDVKSKGAVMEIVTLSKRTDIKLDGDGENYME